MISFVFIYLVHWLEKAISAGLRAPEELRVKAFRPAQFDQGEAPEATGRPPSSQNASDGRSFGRESSLHVRAYKGWTSEFSGMLTIPQWSARHRTYFPSAVLASRSDQHIALQLINVQYCSMMTKKEMLSLNSLESAGWPAAIVESRCNAVV
jgi:hypothetical protein